MLILPSFQQDSSTRNITVERAEDSELRLLQHLLHRYGLPSDLDNVFVGNSESAQLVRVLILAAAETDVPVLIMGSTGTGKEVIARQIHEHSHRSGSRFQAINCGAIPKELFELELFGCEQGALEKGYQTKIGLWQSVGSGTLFLDEIGDLSPDHQVKILRALEENSIRRIGGTTDIEVDARILAATNRNLFAMVEAGDFREDLYYRLRGFFIRTPRLGENREDLSLIATHLWRKVTKDTMASLSQESLTELNKYRWPGNVRELKMMLTNLYALFQNKQPSVHNIRDIFHLEGQASAAQATKPVSEDELDLHRAKCLRHLKRTYEVVHACKHQVTRILQKKYQGRNLLLLAEPFRLLYHDISTLCRAPLLFHGEEVFDAVHGLKGDISYMLNLLSTNNQTVTEYLKNKMQPSLDIVLSAVFREIEEVMSEG